jgi:predicted DNA-binding protein
MVKSKAGPRHRMIVSFPVELHRRLKVLAAEQGKTMTELVLEAVEAAVEIHESDRVQNAVA